MPVYAGGVLAGRTLTQIVAGGSNTCALDSTGIAYCWGLDTSGQLGNNSTTQSLGPGGGVHLGGARGQDPDPARGRQRPRVRARLDRHRLLLGIQRQRPARHQQHDQEPGAGAGMHLRRAVRVALTQITGGFGHTCAVSSAGAAYCWGANGNGQLGNSSTTSSLVPVAVTTSGVLSGVTLTQISSDQGGQYTCALSAAGAAYCWGAASFGQLGNGGSSTPGVPVAVSPSGVLSG